MISSIHVQNFQSHESTEVHLSPGVNVFTGGGDEGKSSIAIRCPRWVAFNKVRHSEAPMAHGYISKWAKKVDPKDDSKYMLLDDCIATITKPEGTCTRFREAAKGKRGKETNGYILNGERFEAIGSDVPEAVSKFFNWSDINFQRQFDPVFLLSKGAGEVASFLNRTVRLDTIDAHIQAASSLVRQERDALKLLEAQQDADSKALEALAWVPGVQVRMEALDAVDKALQESRTAFDKLSRMSQAWEAAEARIRELDSVVSMEPRVQKLRKEWDWFRGILERGHKVRGIVQNWETAETTVKRAGVLADFETKAQECRKLWAHGQELDDAWFRLSKIRCLWVQDSRVVSYTSRVVALEPKVQNVRELYQQALAENVCVSRMSKWVQEWETASKAIGEPVDWEDLEFRIKRARAMHRRREGITGERDALAKWSLTFKGLERIIQESTETISTLGARLPDTCPLCKGPMHKEHGA